MPDRFAGDDDAEAAPEGNLEVSDLRSQSVVVAVVFLDRSSAIATGSSADSYGEQQQILSTLLDMVCSNVAGCIQKKMLHSTKFD